MFSQEDENNYHYFQAMDDSVSYDDDEGYEYDEYDNDEFDDDEGYEYDMAAYNDGHADGYRAAVEGYRIFGSAWREVIKNTIRNLRIKLFGRRWNDPQAMDDIPF